MDGLCGSGGHRPPPHRATIVQTVSPLSGVYEHQPAGLPEFQEPPDRPDEEHAFPSNCHSLTYLYPAQQGGQCVIRLIRGTFIQVQFPPPPKGAFLAEGREKAGLSCRVSPAWHSQSSPAARLAPFALVEYAK